ncbi:MAG: DUF1802 family protein [Dolichospermum lemmermannii FEM_B0920]
MNKSVSIYNALCLPAPDVEALIQGRIIAVIPRTLLDLGKTFALYPVEISTVAIDKYYHPSFLPIAKTAWEKFYHPGMLLQPEQLSLIPTQKQLQLPLSESKVLIKAWAKCELCEILDKTTPLDILSQLTIWNLETLEGMIQKYENIFLAYFRVYHLVKPYEVATIPNIQDKLGKFVSLPNISCSENNPVLNDQVFIQRKQQLEKLEPPLYPELEKLQVALSQIANNNPAAQQLENEIKVFLGLSHAPTTNRIDSDLAWIKNIANVGNSSDGNEFERLVRKSLIKLGFSCSNTNSKANLDPDKLGAGGGVDFYCEYPYQVVGECKATKTEKVPSKTPGQLIQLGKNHLQENYDNCLKLIVAAGELTNDALLTTVNNGIYMIRPETLQNLVELQNKYQNSVNLLELKECLQQAAYGLADDKINEYIDKIEKEIKLRSEIIKTVKELSAQNNDNSQTTHQQVTVTEIRVHYNAINKQNLTNEITHDLLIELSSPLTGYLGREKANDGKTDKFYYLRDLPIN